MHSRHHNLVPGSDVLDLDLGPQLVELEVCLQALRNGDRTIKQIALEREGGDRREIRDFGCLRLIKTPLELRLTYLGAYYIVNKYGIMVAEGR